MITRRQLIYTAAGGALATYLPAMSAVAAEQPAKSTLGQVRTMTITVAQVAQVEAAWTKYLGYQVIKRDRLSPEMAASWGAPALAGKAFVVLGPESGEPTYIRFVEQQTPADFDLTDTYGWRTTEITVQNGDELYARLKDSPFQMRGPPGTIPTYPYLRPLGAVGPGGERLAFTWITEPRPDLAAAKSFVGRCFLAAQTTPELQQSLDFYQTTFGNVPSPIRRLPGFALATMALSNGSKLEVDEHKGPGRPRPRVPGGLPPGLAIVTFECSSFERHTAKFLAPPIASSIHAPASARVGAIVGHSGELIELLEV
jgi:hypothetical protein